MEEVRTGKGREFVFSAIWMLVLLFLGRSISAVLPSYKIIGTLATILMFGVLGFFVLTRYVAVFTYTLKGKYLRINRTIGNRNKEIEIRISAIKSISKEKPCDMPKREHVYNMRTSVFSHKNVWYVEYIRNTFREVLLFEPSEKFADKIKELQHGAESNED